MPKYIDTEKFLEDNKEFADREFIHPRIQTTLRDLVDDAPAADVAPVVHGHWIVTDNGVNGKTADCSVCGSHFVYFKGHLQIDKMPGCPKCLSKMDEVCDPDRLMRTVVVRKGFSYKEEYIKKTDTLHIVNSDGCDWCDGVGVNPNGCFCGECDMISKEECSARTRLGEDDK